MLYAWLIQGFFFFLNIKHFAAETMIEAKKSSIELDIYSIILFFFLNCQQFINFFLILFYVQLELFIYSFLSNRFNIFIFVGNHFDSIFPVQHVNIL